MGAALMRQGKPHQIKRLPLSDVGLNNLVAVPYLLSLEEPLHTAMRVGARQVGILPAQYGLSQQYTINGQTATAYEFMYGKKPSHLISAALGVLQHSLLKEGEGVFKSIYDPHSSFHQQVAAPPVADPSSLLRLSMDSPEQFAMAWTSYEGLDEIGKAYLPGFVAALTDPDEATRQFWPMLGTYSFVHNFIVLEKIRPQQAESLQRMFGEVWTAEQMDASCRDGTLYALDMSVFDAIASPGEKPSGRYTHATYTVLRRHPGTKAIEPVAVWISGKNVDGKPRVYTRATATPGAWLYALQAAKVSATVSGIFLRHVYLWHVLSGVMQMTIHNTMPEDHPVYRLLAPQAKYTIGLDETLLLLWQAGKPSSSLETALEYLHLCDEFAKDRGYFDDDPLVAVERLGLREEDFSRDKRWDMYPVVAESLELWGATEAYVNSCVDAIYKSDSEVAADEALKKWMAASSAPDQGNVRGLEPLVSKAALARLMTSMLYRVIAHGETNMVFPTFIAHLFAPNYPICLQRRDIPEPNAQIDIKQLLTYLPNAETIGLITAFYYGFAFVKPAESFIPKDGVEADLFFPSGLDDARNRALVTYRKALLQFINARVLVPNTAQQWPLNIES